MRNFTPYEHVVSVSGGVDSGATLLRAIERGRPFKAVFADTGHEHDAVYEHIEYLQAQLGIEIAHVRADFSDRIEARRRYVAEHWPAEGIADDVVRKALAALQPTGNPFLDLCLLKGRFPSMKARFCTEELKVFPLFEHTQKPALMAGRAIISWQGVRADESHARSLLPKWQRVAYPNGVRLNEEEAAKSRHWRIYAYRPLLELPKAECFAIYARHGLKTNRLYGAGFGRVGCMLCVNAGKDEVLLATRVCPEHIERISNWESCVSAASKRGSSTLFATADDPLSAGEEISSERHGIRAKIEWAKTSRGGRQYDMLRMIGDYNTPCNQWGYCES